MDTWDTSFPHIPTIVHDIDDVLPARDGTSHVAVHEVAARRDAHIGGVGFEVAGVPSRR